MRICVRTPSRRNGWTRRQAGNHPAQLLTKARIPRKADVSEAGEGWSDSAISEAPDTGFNNTGRTRPRLAEGGLEAGGAPESAALLPGIVAQPPFST